MHSKLAVNFSARSNSKQICRTNVTVAA